MIMVLRTDTAHSNASKPWKGDRNPVTPDLGKKPGTTSGNEDYGSTEREPLDGHNRTDERKPHI